MIAALAPVWLTARAAGICALLLASLDVTVGLLVSTGRLPKGIRRVDARAVHEALGLAALALIVVHGLAILLDPVLKAGLAQVLIPFAMPYRSLATGLGQIAAYGMAALALGYYARARIGAARWRSAHRWIPLFWVLAVAHGVFAGTDRLAWWFLVAVVPPVLAAGTLVVSRLAQSQPRIA